MSDVAISICDLINFTADFIRVVEPKGKGESFRLICPTCTDPTKPSQKYLCDGCKGQFSSGDLDRAREVGKVLHKVTAQEIEATRETLLPEKEIHLHPVSAADFYEHSRADGVAYRLSADKLKDVVAMVTDLVANLKDVVLVGEMNAGRSAEKLFVLTTWKGALVLQEVARPDEVIPFDAEQVTYSDKLLAQATMFVSGQVGEFDAANFANRRKARLAELDAAKSGDTTVPVAAPTAPTVSAADNLLALLEAQIAASKAS
jgi:enamine deaminase RidA (YjgF/YER057c/UK114 family)